MAASQGVAGSARAAETLDLDGFRPTFAAEFDDPKELGERFIFHFRRWGNLRTLANNAEQQIYVDRDFLRENGAGELASPFAVKDGVLTVTARRTPPALREQLGFPFLSGMVTTEESFSQTYGYFEIRCRMPAGQGLWPAFWLVGMTHDEPLEIDVVEVLEHEPSRFYHSIHAGQRGIEWGIDVRGPNSTTGFHTYGVDWTERGMDFYIDRKLVGHAPVELPGPMYMIANLAVGGKWPGNPDESTVFPAALQIDYIRAYQRR